MKKTLLAGAMAAGMALGAFAQGSIDVNISTLPVGITQGGNFFNGAGGLQVWEANVASVPAGINVANPQTGYDAMVAAGFTLQKTYTGVNFTDGGFNLGALNMASVGPAGSTVALAFVAWTGSSANWADAINAQASGGVISFMNATADYTGSPTPSPKDITGWTSNMALTQLTAVPEPTSFALAGLGAAAMLIFRRRK